MKKLVAFSLFWCISTPVLADVSDEFTGASSLSLGGTASESIGGPVISIAHDGNNTKESCMKNLLSLMNGDELAVQSRSAGTGKKTREEINGTRGCPVFMAVAE